MPSNTDNEIPPPLYFKVLLKEVRERGKICELASQFIEEVAAAEEAFGKSLVKTGAYALSQNRTDWPMRTNITWNNICVFSEKIGKQHIGMGLCLSQSIARSFLDYSKENQSQINEMDIRIQSLLEELLKTRRNYDRNLMKYARLIQDTESNIKARDSSVHDMASRMNDQKDVDDGNFLNRSLTKMKGSMQVIGKMTPADMLRKLDEKCKQQIQEIDACEDSLANGAKVYNAFRNDLIQELSLCIRKLEEMEKQRLSFMSEGLARYCMACQGTLDHIEQLVTEQINQSASLDFEAELEALKLENVDITSIKSEEDLSDPYSTNTAAAEKLKDSMEFLRLLSQRANIAMAEIAELGKTFSKQCGRINDRQNILGGAAPQGSYGDPASLLRRGAAVSNMQSLSSILVALESPTTRKGWESMVAVMLKFSEGYLTSSEVIVEKCCASGETLQKRLEIGKKELSDQLIANSKKLETLQANAVRITTKLTRYRKELKELKENSTAAAEEKPTATRDLSDENAILQDEAQQLAARESNSSPNHNEDDQRNSESTGVQALPSEKDKSISSSGINNLATPVRKIARSASVLLPSMPFQSLDPLKFGSALGAAVGLESTSDRKANRIIYLEEGIKVNAEAETVALLSLRAAQDGCISDLTKAVETAKQSLSRDLLNIKMVMQIFMDCNRLCQEICQRTLTAVRSDADLMSPLSDFEYFMKYIASTSQSLISGSSTYNLEFSVSAGTKASFATFEFPPEEMFIPIQNAVVNYERQTANFALTTPQATSYLASSSGIQKIPADSDEINDNQYQQPTAVQSASGLYGNQSTSDEPKISESVIDSSPRVKASEEQLIVQENPTTAFTPKSRKRRSNIQAQSDAAALSSVSNDSTGSAEGPLPTSNISPIIALVDESLKSPVSPQSDSEMSSLKSSHLQLQQPIETPADTASKSLFSPIRGSLIPMTSKSLPSSSADSMSTIAPKEEAFIPGADASAGDKVLESFSCAIYPKRGILTHGRLSVTSKNLLFSGWPEYKISLPLYQITLIEKTNSLMIIPNALLITVTSGEQYFFGSFMERELCYTLLKSMVEVAKCLMEITEGSDKETIKLDKATAHITNTDIGKSRSSVGNDADEVNENENNNNNSDILENAAAEGEEVYESSTDEDTPSSPHLDFEAILKPATHLLTQDLPFRSVDVWKHFWLESSGFSEFLISMGDLEMKTSEWTAVKENPCEDISKLSFVMSRTVDYLHPRSDSMVNFMGPKNATANAVQYLFIPKSSAFDSSRPINTWNVHRGIILTITVFQGIPMADVFKVMQYWTFEPSKDGLTGLPKKDSTTVRMAVAIHYCKMTMLKSSILAGTVSDVSVLVQKWCTYVAEQMASKPPRAKKLVKRLSLGRNAGAGGDVNINNVGSSPVRRGSLKGSMTEVASKQLSEQISRICAETNKKIESLCESNKQVHEQYTQTLRVVLIAVLILVIIQLVIIWRLNSKVNHAAQIISEIEKSLTSILSAVPNK